jgi:hypothetical protein
MYASKLTAASHGLKLEALFHIWARMRQTSLLKESYAHIDKVSRPPDLVHGIAL